MRTLFGGAFMALACFAVADFGVVPNAYENTPGTSTFLYMVTSGRTYQYQIHSDQLTSFVGKNLNGMQWRLPMSSTAAWPPADATFGSFDIFMGPGVDPASRSTTFANNYTGTKTQVRSGSLTFAAGSFASTGSPTRDWGPSVSFSDYLYTGGHLTVELRHTGMTGTTTTRSFDALSTSTSGYGTQFGAYWTGSYTGTAGSNGNFFVTRFSASLVPEPGALLVVGAGLGLMLRRMIRK